MCVGYEVGLSADNNGNNRNAVEANIKHENKEPLKIYIWALM